jgi:hypothetical protein
VTPFDYRKQAKARKTIPSFLLIYDHLFSSEFINTFSIFSLSFNSWAEVNNTFELTSKEQFDGMLCPSNLIPS